MKRLLSILLSLILIGTLVGCSNNTTTPSSDNTASASDNTSTSESATTSSTDTISVVTTIFPQYDFVRQIAGENVELTMLLSPGSESHSYEPSPQDIITIQNADIFIYVGGESDEWVSEILSSMDTSSMEIIAMMESVQIVEEELLEGMEEDEQDHGDGENHENEEEVEYDEHVWTSPINAMAIVQDIADALAKVDSTNADLYEDNAAIYKEELSSLDKQLREVVQNANRTTLIFADRFPFRYLADEYGLTCYAAFPGCSTETEASAATVAFLIDKVNEEKIPVIFFIELSNEKMADTIVESTDAEKLLLHSCHNVTKDDFEAEVTYVSLMKQNIENLKEALN